LFGNGDVQNLEEVVRRVRESGVDGVLVGRAALGTPWFFREKEEARHHARTTDSWNSASWSPSLSARFEMLLTHARQFEAQSGPHQFRRMRKHLGWYCKGFPHAAALRARMFLVSSVADVEAVLADYRSSRLVEVNHGKDASHGERDTASLALRCG
jgi:tRNA-dihydrouridine synthase